MVHKGADWGDTLERWTGGDTGAVDWGGTLGGGLGRHTGAVDWGRWGGELGR